ncbi:MAG: DUF2520 domain-containing protein [Chlorobi bacterium]|nr:MAG: DUF2520 domain-containing protein [Bacteroidota bacterium]KXK34868.1 MAG: hypothetical protein UZ06_CHB003000905 [Chlorobi bacterium OLB6]MBE2264986.1 DUF2520 domain-containing protein [Flavobacteriales bacterium]MBL1161582.1 DUF2520 domain-containing protein [Chlorobiota bacterium]MBW7854165.1 DUF2520 domain-containing protein [Candidatus Kapabacteria bacterium]MCC6332246.1 DUF2520 domain-containing protein [Ignavibacteria bacterium]
MSSDFRSDVVVIGAGAVGTALKPFVLDVVSHAQFEQWLKPDQTRYVLTILAVPDTHIRLVAERIAKVLPDGNNAVIAHVSGLNGPDALHALQECGWNTAAMHPFQTFRNNRTTHVSGIGWGVEADDAAAVVIRTFIERTGGKMHHWHHLSQEQRLQYHAVAVAASNMLYACFDLAVSLAHHVGIPPEDFIPPIAQTTLDNVREALLNREGKVEFPVTGPLARGQFDDVLRQLQALPGAQQKQYAVLAMGLLDSLSDRFTNEQTEEIRNHLLKFIREQ